MHIGIDATCLYGRYGGVEYALWNLLAALSRLNDTNRYTLYIPADGPPHHQLKGFPPNWNWVRLPFSGGHKSARIAWQQFVLPFQLRRDGCDLLHAPTYVCPLRSSIPIVLTAYDLIALTHPAFATPANRAHYGVMLPQSLKAARRIIVPSERVRQDIMERVPQAAQNVRVVPLGVESVFTQPVDEAAQREVRARHDLPARYLLFVGNFEPKKNGAGLLRALDSLQSDTMEVPPLVVVGGARPWTGYDLDGQGTRARVVVPGYVARRDLPALYAGCAAFVFPSLAEGFGLPVLEALAAGAPVITSREVPLPDLASVALICNPHDPASIAAQIKRVLHDAILAAHLRTVGRDYARFFTWRRAAQATLRIYDEAASAHVTN